MDVDQDSFSKQASSLKALIDRFDGHLDEVSRGIEEVETMEKEQAQARKRLHEKATQPVPQPQTQSEPFVFQYVGPSKPVDITMEEAEQSSKNIKRRRQDMDIGTATNNARTYREWQASCKGKTPGAIPPAPSSLSSLYSAQSIPASSKPIKAAKFGKLVEKGSPSTRIQAGSHGHLSDSDDDTNDYGSDTDTVAALYENKRAPKDETITQVMTLLNGLIGKVNNLLDKLPPEPSPTLKNVHPIVARHLVASGKRQPAAPKDNFLPWDQTQDDTRPMDPVRRPVERVAALAYVRVAFAECLGRKSKKDPLPPGPPDDIKFPTRQTFWAKWTEPYNSEFNTAACEIVTRKVMEDFPTMFPEECYEDLFKMVAAHLKYNIVLYRRQNLSPGGPLETKRLAAASSNRRRHTLFQKRLYIARSVKALRPHRRLLKDLGVEGTSSDEEDPQTPGLYRVKRIKQLSSSVVELKQKLDDTFEALVKVPGRKGNRGRRRVRTAEPSSRKFRIKGLPVNCVNRIWYSRLSTAQKGVFRFADYEYDFKFPDELLKM
ncbi:hypothetical protein FRC11_005469 [Ceratobasidium sp. 423]|nr:hypothetical protein FRC11_005469 [Ceratobasidium sp. 423]